MKIALKITLWLLVVLSALVLAFVALHVYYRLTPTELSDDAKALLAETAHMAQLTDNGFRMHGILAPEGIDAVVYGKCYDKAWKVRVAAPPVSTDGAVDEAHSKAYAKRVADTIAECGQGRALLPELKAPDKADRIEPGFDLSRLAAQAEKRPASVYFERWNAVLDGGTRGNDPDPLTAVFPLYTASLQLEHFRLATFASAWQAAKGDEERGAVFAEVETNLPKLIKFADGTLIESMIAAAAISRSLLVIQSVVARTETVDPALAARTGKAITSTENLPRAVANAIGAEVQFARTMGRQIRQHGIGGELVPVLWDRPARFAFDENDTLNMMARGYRLAQAQALLPDPPRFNDSDVVKDLQNYECPSLGEFSFICAFTGRNPTGRILALIAFPAYDQYAARMHDVRNLAAATRLTIEARRQGLRGDALSRFVSSAPAGMRDVFTDKPFAYDATKLKLTIELRTRSTVLGDKSYAMDL